MQLLKKLCSSLIICGLLFTSVAHVGAVSQKHGLAKDIILTKSGLHKIPKGRSYSKSIDTFIEKIGNDQQRIDTIHSRVETIITKYQNKTELSKKEEKMLAIFYYLEAKLEYTSYVLQEEYENSQEAKVEQIVESVLNSQISSQDKNKAEKIILDIQKNILEDIEAAYFDIEEYFLQEIEKQTNYTSNGDFEVNYDFDLQDISSQGEISFQDYTIKNSLFDAQLTGQFQAIISAMENDKESLKMEISTFLDMIQKDGRMFALLKDLEITSSQQEEQIKEFITRAKKLAKENKYLEITDNNSQELYEFMKNFNSKELFNDIQEYGNKPFYTAYKKVDDTYFLVPTKYACDALKQLQDVFDPFGGEKCSEKQYKDALKEILSYGEITLKIDDTYTLNFDAYHDEELETANVNIEFTENEIHAVNMEITPNQDTYPNDGILLDYQKNQSLDFSLNIEDIETFITFNSTLDRVNNFETIDFEGKILDYNDIISWEYRLKNNAFVGELTNESYTQKYDDNWEVIGKEKKGETIFEIDGNFDRNNTLEVLNAQIINTEDNQEVFTAKFGYELPKISLNMRAYDDYSGSEFVFIFDGEWDKNDMYIRDFDLNSHLHTQEVIYDDTTWEIEKTGKIIEVFTADYSLHNNDLKGEITIHSFEGELLSTIISQGEYYGKKGNIDTKITFEGNPLNKIFGYSHKARDSVRISNMRAMQAALEQSYQDYYKYPSYDELNEKMGTYLPSVPKDSYAGKEIDGCQFGYKYFVADGPNGIENQRYKLETCLESNMYLASGDNGEDDTKYEVGVGINQDFDEGIYINNISTWEKSESYNNSNDDLIININSEFDYLDNKTDFELFLEVLSGEKKYGSFEMKNTGEIEYKKQNIQMPENIAPIQEVLY